MCVIVFFNIKLKGSNIIKNENLSSQTCVFLSLSCESKSNIFIIKYNIYVKLYGYQSISM